MSFIAHYVFVWGMDLDWATLGPEAHDVVSWKYNFAKRSPSVTLFELTH